MNKPTHILPDIKALVKFQCGFFRIELNSHIPFFFKQWGEWVPYSQAINLTYSRLISLTVDGRIVDIPVAHTKRMAAVGKHQAGNILNGHRYKQFSEHYKLKA